MRPLRIRCDSAVRVLGVVLVLFYTGCSSSNNNTADTDQIADTVEQSMQEELSTSKLWLEGLEVVEVVVVHASGNTYNGLATVMTKDLLKHEVAVDITADGDKIVWQTEQGAFYFATHDEFILSGSSQG